MQIIAAEGGYKGIRRNGVMWVNTFYPKYIQQYMIDSYEATVKRGSTEDGKPVSEADMKILKEGLEQVKQDLEGIKRINPTFPI